MSTVVIRCGFCNVQNKVERSRIFKANCGKCKHSLSFSLDLVNLPPEEFPEDVTNEDFTDLSSDPDAGGGDPFDARQASEETPIDEFINDLLNRANSARRN